MSVSVTLKDWLRDKIDALSSVQEVYAYMPKRFTGYPAVAILLPELTGEFSSTSTNSRVYSYRINIFVPLGQDLPNTSGKVREHYAEDLVAEVIEDIIDAVETDFDLTDVTQSENIVCKYAEASDMRPFEIVIDNGEHLGAEITISIYTEKTIT